MLRRFLLILILLPALLSQAHARPPSPVDGGPAANAPGTPPAAADDTAGGNPADSLERKADLPPLPLAFVRQKTQAPEAKPPASELAGTFAVSAGETLRTALSRWTVAAGWTLVWDAPNDYSLSAGASFTGEIVPAITQIMESLQANGAPFGAEVFLGNRVVRVIRNR
jgi:type IV pili sensor histidine kinase/response regulator